MNEKLLCEPCSNNTYLFRSNIDSYFNSEKCKDCTNHPMHNCYGGFNLTPKSGYWRINN